MTPSDSFVLLINREGIIVDAHERACSALGWTREDLLNKGVGELLEYGADLLMNHLHELQDGSRGDAPTSIAVSTLVRRRDQGHFPATAVVRCMPELDCFTVGFEDLANEAAEPSQMVTTHRFDFASALQSDHAGLRPELGDSAETGLNLAARSVPDEPSVALPQDDRRMQKTANNDGPKFRNIYLSGAPRIRVTMKGVGSVHSSDDVAAQLETERQERRRLEARIVSLNDQLQQLHGQLKSNLESESIYQKRLVECEEELQKSEQARISSETALQEQQQERERLELGIAQAKADYAQREAGQNRRQQEWRSKLESGLSALQESDARLEKEIADRREIGDSLRMLTQDLSSESGRQDMDIPKPEINESLDSEPGAHDSLEECDLGVSDEITLQVEASNSLQPVPVA